MSDKEAESSDTDVDEFPLSTLKMDSSPEKTSKMDTSPQKTPETSVAFKFSHPLSAQVWPLTQFFSVSFL